MNLVQRLVNEALKSIGPAADMKTGMVLIGNGKTAKSLESKGGCPLMKEVNGHMTSPLCPSCYSVSVMNNYPQVRKNIESQDHSVYDIVMLAAGVHPIIKTRLSGDCVYPGDRLRLYGLTDFSPLNMPAIRMLSRVYSLDIISKTLWMNSWNLQSLVEIAKLPNINISLSFNGEIKNWRQRYEDVKQFVLDNKIGDTVGLNYAYTSSYRKTGRSVIEPIGTIAGCGVFHIVSKDKHKVTRALGSDKGVCGIFTENGTRIEKFAPKGGPKGSCIGCTFCRDRVLNSVLKEEAAVA